VSFGYNERDRWIPEFVFPLVQAFGAEVVTGEDLQGQQITDSIQRQIEGADALMAFRTKRGAPDAEGIYRTHRWVDDELAYGIAKQLRVVEISEVDVDMQGGIAGDRQRITYNEAERDRLLVELAKTIGAWARNVSISLQLLPPEFVEEIRPLLRTPGFNCTYTLLEGSRESQPLPVQVRPIKGGLFIHLPVLSPRALIQVSVEGKGHRWISDYETLDSVAIRLTPEKQ
jgi:hypothetical protein